MPTNQQIIENLNLTGNFLEASIFSMLSNHQHFLATAEWPYFQPKYQGTADIIALNHAADVESEPLVFFAVECKKAQPNQKVWVFDSSRSDRDLRYPLIKKTTTGQLRYEGRVGYLIPDLGVNRVEDAPLYNKGYELRENDANLNRNESERIYVSLSQANRAATAIAKADHKQIFDISPLAFERNPIAIIPVVITNAELKTLSYNPESVSISSGEVAISDVEIEDRDWLIFEYPLSDDLQLSGSYRNQESGIQPIKRPTYIIRANKVIEVMQAIVNATEY